METDKMNEQYDRITVVLDNEENLECEVVTFLEVKDKTYVALLPVEGPMSETGEVLLYRVENPDSQPDLQNIENDEEFEDVSDAFDEYLDAIEFDELVEEEAEEEKK